MALQAVLRSDDLPIGERGSGGGSRLRDEALASTVSAPTIRDARVGDTEILLTRLPSGEAVAFEAYCPHQKVSLKTASVFDGYLRCPQHYYLYDPRSGRNILPACDASPAAMARLKPGCLATYPVEERDGLIWVEESPNPPPAEPVPDTEARPRRLPAVAAARPPRTAVTGEGVRETVTVATGAAFALTLPTRPQPGHLWQVAVSGAELTVLDQEFRPGQDCAYLVHLAAREAGVATVRCIYAQPWSDRARAARTFTVQVRDV